MPITNIETDGYGRKPGTISRSDFSQMNPGAQWQDGTKAFIKTSSGKTYTLDQQAYDWIVNRHKQDWANSYGYDDADQLAKRNGQLSAAARSTYSDSGIDPQLMAAGLPSTKNLEKYLGEYQAWHTGTASQLYQGVSSAQWSKMGEFFKNDWQYDYTAEDQARKLKGLMPAAIAAKYADTELDESLMARNLPPSAELGKYAERYDNYNGINTFYANVAGRWTELRMNDKLDADGNYIKNDDTVYTVDGKKVTGRTLFENEFYDELERTNEDGSLVYGNIYGLFKNNHQYETEEKESENHNIYRGKAITGAGKVEAASDDFANYSAFSYDDFESKYGDYFSKYYADVQLTNTDGTKAMFSDGRPVTVSDALAIFDEAQTEKDRVAFYTIDKLAGDTESSSVSGFIRRWRDKNPGKGYLDMYTDMRDNGVDEKYIKAAKEQNLKAARNIGKDEVKLVKDAWSAFKKLPKTPVVASDNATATAPDGSVSEVQEESADMRVARQIFVENFTPEQLVNHMNSYDEVINPQIVMASAKYYANRGIGSDALSDAMKVAKETYIANTDDVDPEIIKAFDESIQTDKNYDYAQGKASFESYKRDAILAATDTSTILTSEDYIRRTVNKLGGQVGPDELFEIVKATAECPWANKYAVREALLRMGFTANGEFDNAEYANAWTQGWTEEDRTKFRDLLKQNGYRSLNEIEGKPDTAPEWVEPTKADIDLMKDAGKGKDALVDSMYNYVQSHGGWYGEDRTIKLRSYYKSLGLSEFAINDALLTLDWRYLRGDYKDSPSLGGVEDYFVSVVNPDDTLAAGDWQIARDWMDSVIESGEYTPFEAYNVLCGNGLQDEINAFDADGWHEAIYKEKILPEMFNASDWDTKMYWEALTPEQQRETADELWNNMSDEDRAAMFDNYDWRYDPNIYRTAGQAWREQFIAVLPSVVSSVSSGTVGFANAVSNLVSGNEDLWGVTKDLMATDSNVQSFGAVTDGTNGAQLAQLASDAASELIRMQVLGTVGGKLGGAFGNITGLEFLSDYALAPKGVQKLAGMVVDNVKAFPFSAMAIGNHYAELKLKGASNADALPYSFIIGGLEGVWESFNFDKVFGQVLGNGAFGQMLVEGGNAFRAASVVAKARLASIPVSFLAEGTEEGLSYIAEAVWKTAAAWSGKEWAKDFEFSWKDLGTEVAVGGIIGALGAGLASPRITRDSIMVDYYRNNGKVTAASVDVDLSAKWWKSFSEERKLTYRNGGARALSMTDFAGVLTQLDNAYRMLYSEDAEDVKNGNSIKNLELSRQKLETDQDAKVKALEREKAVLQGKLAGLNPYNADDMPEFARVSTLIREKDGAIADAKEKRAAALNAADSNIKTKRAELEAQVSQAQNTLASHFAGIYLRNEQAINAKDHATIENNMANARVNGDNVTPDSVKEQAAAASEATSKLAEAEANETMTEAEEAATASQTPEDAATKARELAYNRVYKDQEAGKAYAEGRRGENDSKMTRVQFAENERQNFQAKTTAKLRRVTLELAGLEAKEGMSAKEIFEEAKKAMTPEAAQKLDMYQKLSKALGLNMVVRDVVAGTSGYVHDGKLYVTLNGKQSMLRVAAHELTHYMKGHAETQYDALRTSLVNEVGQEKFDELLQEKAQEYGLDLNDAKARLEADDEVCAELCEKMLENPDALERFVQSDLDAAKTLKARLGKTLVAIKSAIRSIGTSDAQTKADLIKEQQTIETWYKGLSDAIDNANAEGKAKGTATTETATVTDTTTEAPQAPPVETNPDLFMGEESARREQLRSDLKELAKKGTKVQDVTRQEVNDVLDRVILGDKSNYNKADYAQIRGMLAQLIPEVTAYVNGDESVDVDALNERVTAALDYMLERYNEGSEDYYGLRDLIPNKIALSDTAYKDLRAKDMTLRQASNELTKALGGKFVNFVYKKSPDYNNAMTIDELWQSITNQYGEQNGVGNVSEDALALIDYVNDRNSKSSFDDLYGSQREDMVSSQVGEFLDAVQSMVEGKAAETAALHSIDDDYMPLAEKYDAGIATDEEIAEMQRDVNEAAEAAGFPATQYDPVIYDANGNVVPLSERFSQDFTGNRYTLDDDLDELIKRYGAIEQGREPRARDVQVPRQVDDQTRVSKLIRSGLESATMTDATAEEVKGELVSDIEEIRRRYSYIPKSNDETLRKARDYISRVGISEARRVLHKDSISGNFNLNMEAVGMQLLWDAAERGDQQAVKELYIDLRPYATEAGQRAQLFNMLKEMKGVGSAWYVENLVKDLNTKHADDIATGAIDGPITVSEDAMNQLRAAKTQAEVDAAEGVVATELAAQLPLTWDEKLSNWRYLSMLGNPITHVRNWTGNKFMYRMGGIKDVVASYMQRIFEKTGITDESDRTFARLSRADKAYWDSFVQKSYEEQRSNLQGGGKLGFQSLLQQKKRSFDNKVLDTIARGKNPGVMSEKGRVAGLFENIKNNGAMGMLEVADAWGLEDNYTRALMEYMKAQGYSLNNDGQVGKVGKDGTFTEISTEAMNKAIEWASSQAWTNTFRGPSEFATALNKISKMNPVAKLVVEGVLPFKKTPFNIAKQGFWYSPAGLVTGTVELLTKVKQGKMSAATAIDHMASGLTGTALMALGVVLAKAGILRGGGEDKKKYETYLGDTGEQTYAFKFGNVSINMSAIAPATIPLFMGVALQEMLSRNGEDEGVDLSTITDVLAGTLNPFMEMSFMSSLNSALKNYNNDGIGGALGNTILTAAQNYGSQYLPTLGGKIAQFLDPTQRTTKSSATSPVGGNLDYYWRSLVKKVPGLEATLQPDVNIWGQTTTKDSFGDWALDFANKFILPTNIKVTNRDAVDNELIRVVESTGIVDFLPSDGAKYFKVNGDTYKMNASQYTEYSKERGQAAYAALKDTMASASYKNASDENKAAMLKKALDAAYKQVNNVWKEKLGAYDK